MKNKDKMIQLRNKVSETIADVVDIEKKIKNLGQGYVNLSINFKPFTTELKALLFKIENDLKGLNHTNEKVEIIKKDDSNFKRITDIANYIRIKLNQDLDVVSELVQELFETDKIHYDLTQLRANYKLIENELNLDILSVK